MTPNNEAAAQLLALAEHRRAPKGMIWQCAACGKRSEDSYGMVGWHSYGWDESCMLNAAAVPDLRATETDQ